MKIWEFYENLNEIVYAVNIENYTIEYLNKKALQALGYKSLEEVKYKKCYEILQNQSDVCSFCKTNFLRENEFYEWDFYNPITKHLYNLKDTIIVENEKKYQMEIAIDMTRQLQQRNIIKQYMYNEAMVNEGLRLAMVEHDPDDSIQILIEYLGKMFQSDRAYIFEIVNDSQLSNTHEWCRNPKNACIHMLQNLPIGMIDDWIRQFLQNENVIIRDIEEIKESMPDAYACLKMQNIRSIFVGPIYDKEKLVGFYGVDNPPVEMMNHISVLINVISSFIISFMKKRSLMKELERLSYYDQLTGLKNRHALNEFNKKHRDFTSVGVIYTDINGLKIINDTQGHEAGDKLILGGVSCLKEILNEYEIYRIGGDEFLIIALGITEDILKKRIQDLKQLLNMKEIKMSIGYVFCKECKKNIEELIKMADKSMYEEKQKYYKLKKGGLF